MKRIFKLTIGLLLLLSLAACIGGNKGEETTSQPPEGSGESPSSSAPSSGEADPTGSGGPNATESAAGPGGKKELALENSFGERKFDNPVALEYRADQPDLLYIVEQPGRIVSMNLQQPQNDPVEVLDITDRVNAKGTEQGLLGLAFHPNNPSQAYVNYTAGKKTVIARYYADPQHPGTLDPDSEQILLTFAQPYENHNGGQLAFGPDGYLYIATGDGGSGGDPQNNGQSLDTLLGKILRIDVDAKGDGKAYAIPADNPYQQDGEREIYAYGLRNPWRFSFDSETGELWAADVGQDRYEEINKIKIGGNYGWRIQEGAECFKPQKGCSKEGLEQPVYTYDHDLGVSITGGYVYRGSRLGFLTGWYIYGDYSAGTIWGLRINDDGKAENETLLDSKTNITSFGRDSSGELYICTQEGEIYKLV